MIVALFWILVGVIFYTYFGYPLLLYLMAKAWEKEFNKTDIYPNVTLIIAAYNEERSIEAKIKNSLSLDYPKDKLEIIVASDCSTDRTNEIVEFFSQDNVRFSVAPKRSGKTAGRNRVIPDAKGEIIVLSDATGMYESDCLNKLIRNFADNRIGCVGGLLKYVNSSGSMVGSGEGMYWRYEVFLRKMESSLGNLTAVSGSIYAFRKGLFHPIPEELADDLIIPLTVKELGYYTIYEPQAICIEETTKTEKEESAKRIRIANRNILGLIYKKHLFNVFKYGLFSWELFSHKVLRLLVPIFMIILLVLNLAIIKISVFYRVFLVLQVGFYFLAYLGFRFRKKGREKNRFMTMPLFFCVTNLGILFGIFRFLRGQKKAIWEPSR